MYFWSFSWRNTSRSVSRRASTSGNKAQDIKWLKHGIHLFINCLLAHSPNVLIKILSFWKLSQILPMCANVNVPPSGHVSGAVTSLNNILIAIRVGLYLCWCHWMKTSCLHFTTENLQHRFFFIFICLMKSFPRDSVLCIMVITFGHFFIHLIRCRLSLMAYIIAYFMLLPSPWASWGISYSLPKTPSLHSHQSLFRMKNYNRSNPELLAHPDHSPERRTWCEKLHDKKQTFYLPSAAE